MQIVAKRFRRHIFFWKDFQDCFEMSGCYRNVFSIKFVNVKSGDVGLKCLSTFEALAFEIVHNELEES